MYTLNKMAQLHHAQIYITEHTINPTVSHLNVITTQIPRQITLHQILQGYPQMMQLQRRL